MKVILTLFAIAAYTVSARQKVLAKRNVCWDSKTFVNNAFKAPKNGVISGIELVYRSGGTNCYRGGPLRKWGCGSNLFMMELMQKTGSTIKTLYPTRTTKGMGTMKAVPNKCNGGQCKVWWYQMSGQTNNGNKLTLSDTKKKYTVRKNQDFLLENTEGCCKLTDADNNGRACGDVYFLYESIQESSGGCSARSKAAKTVVNNKLYACSGTISSGGVLGASAAGLCGAGYEVCPSAKRTKALGLTTAKCNSVATANQFFATKETSMGWLKCYSDNPNSRGYDHDKNGVADVNDIFGCSGSGAVGGRLYKTNCGQSLTTAIGNGNWKGWEYTGDGKGLDEANNMKLTSASNGGVLCCVKPPSGGCGARAKAKKTVIKNKLYACSGTISGGGIVGASAASLCGAGYEVCPSAKRTKALGLTTAKCNTVATANQFFATKETSMGWLKCYSDNPNSRNYDHDKNGVADVNDIFGCSGSGAVGGRLYKTNCGQSLTTAIGNGNWKGWTYTGDGKGLDELNNMKLTSASNGGVLCCAKPGRRAAAAAPFVDDDEGMDDMDYIDDDEDDEPMYYEEYGESRDDDMMFGEEYKPVSIASNTMFTLSNLLIASLVLLSMIASATTTYACFKQRNQNALRYKMVDVDSEDMEDMEELTN